MRRLVFTLATMALAIILASPIALAAIIDGTSGNDTLKGTAEIDTIEGGDGNDTIYGYGGSDTIEGEAGQDGLFGGNDNDIIDSGTWSDEAQGGLGSDILNGDLGDDTLSGADDTDIISGDEGNDTVSGGLGFDALDGGPGTDDISGGDGDDTISSGPENDSAVDTIHGDAGDDEIMSANIPASRDVVDCGDGTDMVEADMLDEVASNCEDVEVTANVTLAMEQPEPVQQALDVAKAVNASPKELIATYQIGDDEYTAGYVLTNENSTPSPQAVTQTMIEWFEQDRQMVSDPEANPEGDPLAASELSSVINSLQSNGARIKEMRVLTTTPIAELEQDPRVRSAADVATLAQNQEEPVACEPANYNGDADWAPKRGYIETRCCSYDRRYVYQSFKWNSWRLGNLKAKNSRPAFESDATYPRKSGTYLGEVVGFSSNLPDSYRETEVSDISNIRRTGVGTTDVEKLRADKYYYGIVRTKRGKDNSETGGVAAQYGKRVVGCHGSAWCVLRVWGHDIILRPTVGYNVPGYKTYHSGS